MFQPLSNSTNELGSILSLLSLPCSPGITLYHHFLQTLYTWHVEWRHWSNLFLKSHNIKIHNSELIRNLFQFYIGPQLLKIRELFFFSTLHVYPFHIARHRAHHRCSCILLFNSMSLLLYTYNLRILNYVHITHCSIFKFPTSPLLCTVIP